MIQTNCIRIHVHPSIVNLIDIIPYLVTCKAYEVGHLTDAVPVFGVRGSVRSGVALVHSGYRVEPLYEVHWAKPPEATYVCGTTVITNILINYMMHREKSLKIPKG